MDPAPSAELLNRHVAGDPLAADEILARYHARLLGLVRSLLAKQLAARLDPEDILQSAYRSFFVKARDGRFTVCHPGDLRELLFGIVRHKLLHAAERQTARKRSPNREVAAAEPAVLDLPPDQTLQLSEELQAIAGKLTPELRAVLEMRLQDLDAAAIAQKLGKSERTIRRQMLELRRVFERQLLDQSPAPVEEKSVSRVEQVDYREFTLEQLIGSGGFGKVYRAYWRTRQTTVAIKMLRKQFLLYRRAVQRFIKEAEVIAGLRHPGIIRLHGLGRTPAGGYFLALDWHSGGDLTQANNLPATELAEFIAQAAEAVAFAHAQGIVHCDLKPSNLLVDDHQKVVVTDFGFAVGLRAGSEAFIGGTRGYLAPEILRGEAPSQLADVYSLGRILLELLPTATDGLGPRLQATAAHAAHDNPDVRLQSAQHLADQLRGAMSADKKQKSPCGF